MRNAKEMIQELVLMIEEYAENAVANALRAAPTATAPAEQGYSREQVREREEAVNSPVQPSRPVDWKPGVRDAFSDAFVEVRYLWNRLQKAESELESLRTAPIAQVAPGVSLYDSVKKTLEVLRKRMSRLRNLDDGNIHLIAITISDNLLTAQGYSREQVRRAYIDGQADDATADTVEEYLSTLTPEGEKR